MLGMYVTVSIKVYFCGWLCNYIFIYGNESQLYVTQVSFMKRN